MNQINILNNVLYYICDTILYLPLNNKIMPKIIYCLTLLYLQMNKNNILNNTLKYI